MMVGKPPQLRGLRVQQGHPAEQEQRGGAEDAEGDQLPGGIIVMQAQRENENVQKAGA